MWAGTYYLTLDDLYVRAEQRGWRVGEQLTRADVRAQRFYQRIGSGLFTKVICRWQVTEPVPSASRESPHASGDE
ncbi:hypothetical protein [Nonomuraea jabiensis]|uniref:hypothetical protein n=1 Tax=Nonomuraea jabiensis TaxID=882448 RepID=UPI0036B9ABD3